LSAIIKIETITPGIGKKKRSFFHACFILLSVGLMLIRTGCPAQEMVGNKAALNATVFPSLKITYNQEPSEYCVFTVLSNRDYSVLNIFAPNGEALFYRKIDANCYDFKLLSNGFLSYFDDSRRGHVILDSLYQEVDFIKVINSYQSDFHEIRADGDGGYFLIGSYRRELDMSKLVEGGYSKAQITEMVIQRIDADKNVVFEWNTADHYNVVDSYVRLTAHVIDYVHFNSIEIDTDTSIIVSSRNLSELTRIDLNTGTIIWRLGGKNNQFTLRNFDRHFTGQHTIRKKTDSTYTLYDNGIYTEPRYSMGVEFRIDEDSMIAEQLRTCRHEPDVFAFIVGNLQNLDNGNTLVFWGATGTNEDDIGGFFSEYNDEHTLIQKGSFLNCEVATYRVQKFRWRNPYFSLEPSHIDLTATAIGDSSVFSVLVTNHSPEYLVLNDFKSRRNVFRIQQDEIQIGPGKTSIVDVVFKPAFNEVYHDTLTLLSRGEDEGFATQLSCSGTGYGYTGMQNSSPEMPKLFPLPFTNVLHYDSPFDLAGITIRDLEGRVIFSRKRLNYRGSVQTGNIPAGIYIVSFYMRDGSASHRKVFKNPSL